MSILAIDQGTTGTHAILVDSSGGQQTVKALKHKQFYPKPGWVEHDPEELLQNIQLCIDSCDDDIRAIGVANQGESCLAWDADSKRALSPVIVWQDRRTHQLIEQLKSKHQQQVLDRSGLPLDSYFSASKLAWIVDNIPSAKELLHRGKLRLGTTDAFFLDRLTGCFVTDITTASRTSLMNLHTGQWDEELCQLFRVPLEALPEIITTTGDFGSVESKGRKIPITASIVDQQAALYGHGCRVKGDAKITFGTGAFALVLTGATPQQSSDQGLLPTVAWQIEEQKPVYALDGGIFSAGSAINWAQSLGLFQNYQQIQQFNKSSAIERNLAFVPALAGLGCPYWDRNAAGLWIGLSLDTKPIDLIQSILEGIAFRAAEVINSMNKFVAIKGEISIDGGLAENPYLCQFLADVLKRQVIVQPSTELTAYGAACLAADEQFKQPPMTAVTRKYSPQTNRHEHMMKFQKAIDKSTEWRN